MPAQILGAMAGAALIWLAYLSHWEKTPEPLVPIPGKGTSDFGYVFVPIIGPLVGAILARILVKMIGI